MENVSRKKDSARDYSQRRCFVRLIPDSVHRKRSLLLHPRIALIFACSLPILTCMAVPVHAAPIHTTYLWHMHQPIYWPDRSTWFSIRY